jgi:hypothetical protein
VTLKDRDFQKMEKKLEIPENLKKRLKSSLYSDAFFFKEVGLIDYSLLIMIVNWGLFLKENEMESLE